uniref:Plastidic phosphate translocator-like protein n=1 Tax=Tetraselmis sp. GSL018 TaxID=582737 RepID=A0A061RF95_9CHLO|mmetsp:Transcript_13162/g.31173  ORF Transcript_13162/g.31173 Transcript_13162/m.31173 type:complete len:341 (+) Transcript_13162:154-1176(+)|eukprot:CAMPEP_0177625542 /NCGR_PEP_ID=MMETSP0419_2-20121207/30160_1 /TAXON_ID=582737 /ORGANISM="Tetraselmis sp., Strain GSL018" /LENGTH=340 /DNA_ID=CAMNT_0019126505 /DNA_START=87 /DNA_END=1109 /DNA_ORIENTATION=-
MALTGAQIISVATVYGYVAIWIGLSGAVILFNKWILAFYGFPYPIALTMMHMGFCSTVAFVMIKTGFVKGCDIGMETYLKAVAPIGLLYSGVLWLGNAAYLYLSVSFIQMLKALMPVAVFCVGNVFGTEKFDWSTLSNMIVISIGVCIASFGEINFVVAGVVMQLMSIVMESSRLTLVQLLLQSRGLKLNPITSLYYISPACFVFLSIPFALYEAPRMMSDTNWKFGFWIMLLNCVVAFGLNLAVFLLIGKTSALTMNIAGVVKDWMLIGLSVALYSAPVTKVNLIGYGISFLAVGWYNYTKLQRLKKEADEKAQASEQEMAPLSAKQDSSREASGSAKA